ncbi:hypothetical protein JHW43_003567 [Diplocarpon mali]|nr:hypothetical protein JHW43_003567 [Diplocarpon mali]
MPTGCVWRHLTDATVNIPHILGSIRCIFSPNHRRVKCKIPRAEPGIRTPTPAIMNDQSPPTRVTRARAAAKTDIKTTKIATAAAKAKVNRTTATTRRKNPPADDAAEEELSRPQETIEPEPKPTRVRTKRTAQPEPEPAPEMNEAPIRPTRGRPKKVAVPVENPAPEPARPTRGRAKKADVPEEVSSVAEGPPKRPTRARAATVGKVPAPKKSVKFEEADKENIAPVNVDTGGKAKAEPATGLRAKPVRKPAATATARTTRGRPKNIAGEKSSPLSPKKATQVATAKEPVSEDELATTVKTPMKPLMKSPVKPPGSALETAKKLDFSTSASLTASRATAPDLKGSIIASPARRPPQSPFKEAFKASAQKLATMGNSVLQSPFKPSLPAPKSAQETSSFQASLLQSPARRPQPPTKVSENGSPTRSTGNDSLLAENPKLGTLKISRFATPRTLNKSVVRTGLMLPPGIPVSAGSPRASDDIADGSMMGAEPSVPFSGRLSSIMPREADPALTSPESITEARQAEESLPTVATEQAGEPTPGDELVPVAAQDPMDRAVSPTPSPPRNSRGFSGAFALRDRDESPFDDSDSEDELASDSAKYSPDPIAASNASPDLASLRGTPSPFEAIAKTPKTVAPVRSADQNKLGFTPLARQLSEWMAASLEKPDREPLIALEVVDEDVTPKPSPAKSTFFEDEMSVRDEWADGPEVMAEVDILEENFEPVQLDDEDLALAHEADEMSMLEPGNSQALVSEEMLEESGFDELLAEEAKLTSTATPLFPLDVEPEAAREGEAPVEKQEAEVHQLGMASTPSSDANYPEIAVEQLQEPEIESAPEPALSEASEEYGDENAMPIDPQLLALEAQSPAPQAYSTPQPKSILGERVFHTVSKVPLKAAAAAPSIRASSAKRSASISRLPPQRPTSQLSRGNTVISYSPCKKTPWTQPTPQGGDVMPDDFATPARSAAWSNTGTPARTPRRDVNTALLKGAVVFVDVHTSEGADASALFTELLTQMGARCVKTWNWNGNAEDTSKIGITHVVFKDGGKRTLERARETNGVVACVGVGWVLDCERENKWLDESAYSVDTESIPRGGHRRRKSMEPRALAKMNGELLSSATPNRNMSSSREFLHFPDTPATSKSRRRESVQWFRSPVSSSGEVDDETLILSPIPATPAPETISAYGEDGLYGEDTPVGQSPYYLQNASLVQKTAPAGRRYVDTEQEEGQTGPSLGAGFLRETKDEGVMARLLLARRKSLQFAPKVGSPLARGS